MLPNNGALSSPHDIGKGSTEKSNTERNAAVKIPTKPKSASGRGLHPLRTPSESLSNICRGNNKLSTLPQVEGRCTEKVSSRLFHERVHLIQTGNENMRRGKAAIRAKKDISMPWNDHPLSPSWERPRAVVKTETVVRNVDLRLLLVCSSVKMRDDLMMEMHRLCHFREKRALRRAGTAGGIGTITQKIGNQGRI